MPDDGWLAPDQLFELLASWGLPVAPWRIAHDADSAAQAAAELGFPAVLKAIRPGLLHKTEAGAVRLALADAASVRDAFGAFTTALGDGAALVQRQHDRAAVELMLGALHDASFGPLVLCGLGGIWSEAIGDVALRAAPIGTSEAARAFGELRASSLLDGARGAEPVDRDALASLLSQLSICIARSPWCRELDLNPVLAHGNRFVIVDARMRVERQQS